MEGVKNQPTPLQDFIAEVAKLTHRSEGTVKMWMWGKQVPDDLTKSVLAKHFGTSAEALFPRENRQSDNR